MIGGAEGADYVRAWKAKLSEVSNPVVKVAHALSNVIGAIAIRVIAKTVPRARRVLAASTRPGSCPARRMLGGPARLCSALLDAVASSELLAYLLVGLRCSPRSSSRATRWGRCRSRSLPRPAGYPP